jgi:hypothetical protein
LEKWKVTGKVNKVFEKEMKGYVYNLDNATSKIHLPKDDKTGLALVQSFLVIQVNLPIGKTFHLEIGVQDS